MLDGIGRIEPRPDGLSERIASGMTDGPQTEAEPIVACGAVASGPLSDHSPLHADAGSPLQICCFVTKPSRNTVLAMFARVTEITGKYCVGTPSVRVVPMKVRPFKRSAVTFAAALANTGIGL